MAQIDKQSRRLGRRTLQVYQETDPIAQAAAKKMGATCSEGCAHCCYLLTTVTIPEAVAIAEHLLTDLSWQAQLSTLVKKLYDQLNELADPNITKASYFDKKIPCIFLRDNKCGIYKIRPTACRYHYVVSDPKNCAHGAENTETARIDLVALEARAWSEGQRVSRQVGIPMTAAPLQVSLMWALKLLAEGREAFEKATKDQSLGVMSLGYWLQLMVTDSPLAQSLLEEARGCFPAPAPPVAE
jgi:Fe-S-cluster containining protein